MKWIALNKVTKVVEMVGFAPVVDEHTTFPEGYDIIKDVDTSIDVEPGKHKLVDGRIVPKTTTELNQDELIRRLQKFPDHIDFNMDIEQVDAALNDYFFGQVDAGSWKLQHYSEIRQSIYPPIEDYIDAQVKIHTDRHNEGQIQLQAYYEQCAAVKDKYPKE